MARYFGFRGNALGAAMIWAVIMPAYILYVERMSTEASRAN